MAADQSIVPIPGLRVGGIGDALLGALLGGGVLLAIGMAGSYYLEWRMKHFGQGAEPLPEHVLQEGEDEEELELVAMGGGDIKLMAMLGAFLGWRGAYLTILLASMVGAVVGVALLLVARKGLGHRMPFGPYLCAGGFLALVAYDPIMQGYGRFIVALAHMFGAPA